MALDSAGQFWLTQARPITTLYPFTADAPAGPAGTDVPELGSRLDQADHSDGNCSHPVDWHIGGHRAKNATRSAIGWPALRCTHLDSGSCGHHKRAAQPDRAPGNHRDLRRHGGASVGRAEDTRAVAWSFRSLAGSHHASAHRRVLLRNKVPVRAAMGLANPKLAVIAVAATERRHAEPSPANATATQRLDFVEQRRGPFFLIMPRTIPYAGGWFC